ncbi:MAG TPA: acyltransferase [Gammaproteobacteria bacterium]|nr:acyltransferase [Gammaproteobacteria bacterium]
MFGYLRFFLASLVLMSHLKINLQGANPGVAAVVSFYMLAGFVVCNLFSKIFVSRKPIYLQFYYERALRIFPQYIFIACLTLIFLITTKYGSPKFETGTLINNILIIPLSYHMYIDSFILQKPEWWLVPPAWSLGVELQAYLVLPFIIYFKPVKVIAAAISFFIFCLASLGVIQTDYFGYKLFPGVLFIFILGVSIYKNTSEKEKSDLFDEYFPPFVYMTLILLFIFLGVLKMLTHQFVRETIIGILIGMPIIIYIAKSKIKIPMNNFLGDLSYGLFLSHFLSIWTIEHYQLIDRSISPYSYISGVFVISLLISIVGVIVVEKNIKKYRYHLSRSIT